MAGGYNASHRANANTSFIRSETLVDPDEEDSQVAMPIPQPEADDEGLHLLYDYTRLGAIPSDAETMEQARANNVALQQAGSSSFSQEAVTVEVESVESPDDEATVQGDIEDTPTSARRRTVRFRSRVRIGSGIHSFSASSSTCESAASSISVPLRGSGPTESNRMSDTNFEPLSAMLDSESTNQWLNGLSAARRGRPRQSSQSSRSSLSDERTPLNSSRRRLYTQPDEAIEDIDEEEQDRLRVASRKTAEEVMFGKWPWRVFNLHVSRRLCSLSLLLLFLSLVVGMESRVYRLLLRPI
ncbi:hypothetical protein M422DRAFT_30101 [Sphaerobolus stellatus SS14]|uniref:Uncharacterized protein n=1 Tax=Sphaerobolus stellatus (strain SS14) TaxID=990650 RepID=A0A0C9W174_SPHS4|nr:hypothetical protein M422DRAFT_30101 [Sphaerobolus stellatus SS14]